MVETGIWMICGMRHFSRAYTMLTMSTVELKVANLCITSCKTCRPIVDIVVIGVSSSGNKRRFLIDSRKNRTANTYAFTIKMCIVDRKTAKA